MRLKDYKAIFAAVGLILTLLIASPAIASILPHPSSEKYSEIYLLGPERRAENYPFNLVVSRDYSVYVGIGNQIGSSAYYGLYFKFGNETDLMPNTASGSPSPLQPIYEYKFFVENGQSTEKKVTFSIKEATISGNQSVIRTLTFNSDILQINKTAQWDSNATAYPYRLMAELWLYNIQSNQFEYNNRFLCLPLNITQ
jgi:uncharacterized membrane protein